MKLKHWLLATFIMLFSIFSLLQARADASTNNAFQVTDTGRVLVEYSQFIRDETARHQTFLETTYDKLAKLLVGVVVVFGAVFTWLNWKTKKDIHLQVNKRIDSMAKVAIDSKLKAFDEQLQSVRGSLDAQVKALRDLMEEQLKDINQAMFSREQRARPTMERILEQRILWVDDCPENNEIPAGILRSHGIEIVTALSTEQALREIESQAFDLIISDMGRGTNYSAGLDLLKALRDRKNQKPVIIFCSSRGVREFGAEAQNLGAIAVTTGFSTLLGHVFSALNPTEN